MGKEKNLITIDTAKYGKRNAHKRNIPIILKCFDNPQINVMKIKNKITDEIAEDIIFYFSENLWALSEIITIVKGKKEQFYLVEKEQLDVVRVTKETMEIVDNNPKIHDNEIVLGDKVLVVGKKISDKFGNS